MEISASAAQGRVVQLSSVEQAQQVVVAKQTDQFAQQGLSPSGQAANIHTSTNYSPSLSAQAAQFQLYTSSGTLSALLTQQGASAPHSEKPFHASPDDITAVEPVDGPSIDTRA